ncbi:SusC/RagA family TonB-linked outer membrane protein [Persicitalea jodogahamensis]|uniref:SusC/RagA family TonB-linked outer membrane protein n=1 Tax=Persicitalea jodogahamensis TaxID=402147 RepID=A0A8J3GAQ2_9BACT|nr:SusC/RagA family TonB-linked outer membrane protein [Persicitalea jodogahamensis]
MGLLLGVLLTVTSYAQDRKVSGKVTDQKGDAMPGVNVASKGTTRGTSTNAEGMFELSGLSDDATLVFSFIGYKPVEISVGSKSALDVVMDEENQNLNEVVVVGYGTQKKGDITGAVVKYKNESLDEAPVARIDQALQGKIAGVQIQNTSSEAGSDPKIRIRGVGSVNAGANPLVVVDGHPVADGLAFVNTADVESVEVLKDAASAAIYGSRGASGVILITTKSGKSEKTKYNVKYSQGVKSAYSRYDILSTSAYVERLFDEAAIRATDPAITAANNTVISADRAAYILEKEIIGGETDWQSQALRTANVRNVQLNVSGGTRDTRYYISGGYQNDQGIMYHSEYEKFNVQTKLNMNLGKRVKLNINLSPSFIKRERPGIEFNDFARWRSFHPVYLNETSAAFVRQNPLYADVQAGDYAQARYFANRTYSGLMPDGSTWSSGTSVVDPFATSNQQPKSVLESRNYATNDYRVLSSGDLTINLLPGLDFKTLASAYVNVTNGLDYTKRNSARAGDVNRGVYNNNLFVDLLSENTLNYTRDFNKHSFGVLAGYTAQVTTISQARTTGLDYPSDNITTLNTALSIDRENTYTTKNKIGLLSYLGRVNYSYSGKYLLAASFRVDGSSYFAPGNKWGYFPSASVGWIVSEESFMKSVNWLTTLKLRGSYGVTGNNRIVDFAFVDLLYNANYPLGAGTGTVASGQVPSKEILSNANITWERTFQYNGGLDVALFRNAVSFALDVYQSQTDQLLLRQATQAFTGVPQTWNNIGSLQNRGIEFELTTNNVRRSNFEWRTSANISRNTNKILALGSESQLLNQGERTELYLNQVGGPLVQFMGYKTDGVWLSQNQIAESKLTSALSNVFVPGGLKLVDINNDGKLDINDRTVIGNPYPDFIWGLTNNFKVKGFDLSFMLQGSQGGQVINGDPNYNEIKRTNANFNTTDKWLSPLNPGNGKTPYYTSGFNWMLTDYVVEDASYQSLREVIVGYTLPKQLLKRMRMGSVRFYANAQNLLFLTAKGYRGLNPEAASSSGVYNTPLVDGYQRGSYPINKSFRLGVDVSF